MRNTKVKIVTECAMMVALAFALSCAQLFKMPLGGSVTVASMLPIMLIGVKYGNPIGLSCAFVYSLLQCAQALVESNVFPYCETSTTLVVCVLFDYLVPFTILGFSGIFRKHPIFKSDDGNIVLGMSLVVLVRFICHFITGVVIWGQWAPDGMGKFIYSFLYNGTYLSLDFIICILITVYILKNSEIKRLINK